MTVPEIPQIEWNNKHISSRQTGLCHYENKAQNCVGAAMRTWGELEANVGTTSLRVAPARCKPLAVTSVTNSIQFHSAELKRWGVQSRGKVKRTVILYASDTALPPQQLILQGMPATLHLYIR